MRCGAGDGCCASAGAAAPAASKVEKKRRLFITVPDNLSFVQRARHRAHQLRPSPARGGDPLSRLREAGLARHRARGRQRRALRGVGAKRPRHQRRRRLQRLERWRASDAHAAAVRLLGDVHSGTRAGCGLQVRSVRRRRTHGAEGRPSRALLRDAAADGVDRVEQRRLPVGRRGLDVGAARAGALAAQADVGLRGAPGQLAAIAGWAACTPIARWWRGSSLT